MHPIGEQIRAVIKQHVGIGGVAAIGRLKEILARWQEGNERN